MALFIVDRSLELASSEADPTSAAPAPPPEPAPSTPDWLDPWALKRTEYQVQLIKLACGLQRADADDVRQELLLDLWLSRHRFNPSMASRRTFICRVLVRGATRMRREIRRRRQRARMHRQHEESYRLYVHQVRSWDIDPIPHLERALDVAATLSTLPPDLARIAVALMEYTPTEAAKVLGCDRATVYRKIPELRTRFAKLRN